VTILTCRGFSFKATAWFSGFSFYNRGGLLGVQKVFRNPPQSGPFLQILPHWRSRPPNRNPGCEASSVFRAPFQQLRITTLFSIIYSGQAYRWRDQRGGVKIISRKVLPEMSSGDMAFPELIICHIAQAIVDVSKIQVTMWIQTSRIGDIVIFFFPESKSAAEGDCDTVKYPIREPPISDLFR
jgi:hypothetical protein